MKASLRAELAGEVDAARGGCSGDVHLPQRREPSPARLVVVAPLDPDCATGLLTDGDYGLRLTRTARGLRLEGAGSGVDLGAEPTWLDLHRVLVRLRRRRRRPDPRWLERLSTGLRLGRSASADPVAHPELRERWKAIEGAVEGDVSLRMHCTLRWSERTAQPAPGHPMHPGGTVVVGLPALVHGGPDRHRGLLGEVVAHRHEHREHERGYFLEQLVRPLARVFRTALDTHGLVLGDMGAAGFELTTELQATGRIVLTPGAVADTSPEEAARSLDATVRLLASAFGEAFGHDVRADADAIVRHEMRYLRPHAAIALDGDHPLREYVHCVPDEQDDLLKGVLQTVQERTRARRWHPERARPTVVLDADRCTIAPLRRTREATMAVSGPRVGAPQGIRELADPDRLRVLPTCAESTWDTFLARTGLRARYPQVGWAEVRAEFVHAFAASGERGRADEVVAGLARFVWDVLDAGGDVVLCSGRRADAREHTETVLAEAGVPAVPLLCLPEDRSRTVPERKVEQLRGLGAPDVVAVFDDLVDNRSALATAFPQTQVVAVELNGFATERRGGQPTSDGAPVITAFETSPRRLGRRHTCAPTLSHAHSLEELQIGQLRSGKVARRWAVHLDRDETLSVVDTVLEDVDRAADRTARSARRMLGLDENAPLDVDSTLLAVHHILTRKQFLKGSRSHYRPDDLRRDALSPVRTGQPISVVLLGFPVKQCLNRLKAAGPLPDLAELGGLIRLRELHRAVSAVHPPGICLHVLTDGRHFRPRPAALTDAYGAQLQEYLRLAGIEHCTTIREIDDVAREQLGDDAVARRPGRIATLTARLREALGDLDVTDSPLRTLDAVAHLRTPPGPDAEPVGRSLATFRDMVMSVVYSVPVPRPRDSDRLAWSARVFTDLYDLTSPRVPAEVRSARAAVLRRAWHTVIRYLATLRVDEELGYETMFDHRVRLTVSAVMPGRCGFTYLGGSGLLPWQGTGVVDGRGHVAVDFAISLLDQGFVPVYSSMLGPRQPWTMVPAQCAVPSPGGGLQLDDDFASRIRLRRK